MLGFIRAHMMAHTSTQTQGSGVPYIWIYVHTYIHENQQICIRSTQKPYKNPTRTRKTLKSDDSYKDSSRVLVGCLLLF